MDKPHFVVPDHIFDNRRSVPVEDVDLEVFPQLCTQSSTAKISVARGLQADTLAIEFDGRQIGIVRSKLCPELQWLVDAGLIPIATMRFRGGQEHTAELVLPPDGRCIPANNPPAAPWTMLEGTTPIALPSPANRLIFNAHGQQQFLVTLRVKRTLTCRKVNAYIDDVFVGSLPRKQGQALAETILNLHHQGIVAVARALYTPRVASTSLTVYADSLSESRIRAIANGGVTLGTIGIATAIAARNKSHAAVLSSAPATTTALGVGTAAVASVSTVAAVVAGGAAVYETSPEVAPPSIEAAPQQDYGALPLGQNGHDSGNLPLVQSPQTLDATPAMPKRSRPIDHTKNPSNVEPPSRTLDTARPPAEFAVENTPVRPPDDVIAEIPAPTPIPPVPAAPASTLRKRSQTPTEMPLVKAPSPELPDLLVVPVTPILAVISDQPEQPLVIVDYNVPPDPQDRSVPDDSQDRSVPPDPQTDDWDYYEEWEWEYEYYEYEKRFEIYDARDQQTKTLNYT